MIKLLNFKKSVIGALFLFFLPVMLLGEIIDSFNSISSWYTYEKDGNLTITANSSGYSGNCMDLSYTFTGSPGKVSAKKDGVFNFSLVDSFSFFLKGCAPANVIYFKVKDNDGTKFSITVASNLSNNIWTNIVIKRSDMIYDANSSDVGNDTVLSWDNVKTVEFRIQGTAASSTLIDELKYSTLADKTKKMYSEDNIVDNIKILYNPYSPATDGDNRIKITLKRKAAVKIILYDISGSVVSEINNLNFVHYYEPGVNEFYWNGRDKNNKLLNNGLYVMYVRLTSETGESFTEKIILSVLK